MGWKQGSFAKRSAELFRRLDFSCFTVEIWQVALTPRERPQASTTSFVGGYQMPVCVMPGASSTPISGSWSETEKTTYQGEFFFLIWREASRRPGEEGTSSRAFRRCSTTCAGRCTKCCYRPVFSFFFSPAPRIPRERADGQVCGEEGSPVKDE